MQAMKSAKGILSQTPSSLKSNISGSRNIRGMKNPIWRMNDKTMHVFGLPIDWKKFVIIVCMAITGKVHAQIRRPVIAISFNAISFENNRIIGSVAISHSKNTENMKAKAIVNPVFMALSTRSVRPAPKLYPIMGCIPTARPIIIIENSI